MNRIENKQLLQENIFRITDLHRDELQPSVRSYADNLHGQIVKAFEDKGIGSLKQFEEMQGKFTLDELRRIQNLMQRLSGIAQTGKLVTQEEDSFINNQIMEKLKPAIKEWEKMDTESFLLEEDSLYANFIKRSVDIFKTPIDSTLPIPKELLQENPYFLQHIFEQIYVLVNKEITHKAYVGFLFSLILNYSFDYLYENDLETIIQKLDFTDFEPLCLFGYNFNGGKLEVKGNLGRYAFNYMKRGETILENTDGLTGAYMSGGKISLKRTEDNLGTKMTGGEIQAEIAGDGVGVLMNGGKIIVKQAGGLVGWSMRGGEIFIEESYESVDPIPGKNIYFKGKKINR